jgi:hypothetical protein
LSMIFLQRIIVSSTLSRGWTQSLQLRFNQHRQ